eukprot:3331178-Rhodomonas_salina.1
MDTRSCLNCAQAGHSLIRCPTLARDFVLLPCALCCGQHWERSCWGPRSMRGQWAVKRENFFKRADHAVRNQNLGAWAGAGANGGRASGGEGGGE